MFVRGHVGRYLRVIGCNRNTIIYGRWPSIIGHIPFEHSPFRRAKSTKTILVKDLPQGLLDNENDFSQDAEAEAAPQYPAVVQGAKNNMLKYKDCVLLTRVGKFYELYLDQAEEYAPLLDLKLASKKTSAGRVAMAGFPYTQLDKYLKVLVNELDKNVAISEEYPFPPSQRPGSGGLMFDRMVKRIVTPGTLIDESFLDPLRNNYLLALHFDTLPAVPSTSTGNQGPRQGGDQSRVGLAWTDLSTGQFYIGSCTMRSLPNYLARINARETIIDPASENPIPEILNRRADHTLTYLKPDEDEPSLSRWSPLFETDLSSDLSLDPTEASAMHLLLSYARSRIDSSSLKLQYPRRADFSDVMVIDRSTLRGLEILETAREGLYQGSLLHAIRRTVTKGGARLLRFRLTSPSASLSEIDGRLGLVSTLLDLETLRQELVNMLRKTHDTGRLVQKIALNRCEPDDLICLARAIHASEGVHGLLQESTLEGAAMGTSEISSLKSLIDRIDLDGPSHLAARIGDAIDEDGLDQMHRQEDEESLSAVDMTKRIIASEGTEEDLAVLPSKSRRGKTPSAKEHTMTIDDTWIMRRTASTALRKLHKDLDFLKVQKGNLTEDLQHQLGAPSLTLKWSPSLGYFAHVKGADKKSLDHLHARIVSSSKSTKSVVLEDWSKLGADMDLTRSHIREEEQKVFSKLRDEVRENIVKLRRNAEVMDEIDVACSFATLAKENHLVRPMMNNSTVHKIYGGRHPTVELGLAKTGRRFIRNDCLLDTKNRLWLVTGPNMAGKSTFLRQNALITVLAQVGSYVPADYAELGIVDRIFSRVGAADDLFRDQSTFMVEMEETAEILRNATPRSFVVMDEVGRGTSPSDGAAVAYACLHHLHYTNKCRTLFATHFHNLADMANDFEHAACYCTRVDIEDGSFTFVHKVEKGVNRKSHALEVARLAGLPNEALVIAATTLDRLTHEHESSLGMCDENPSIHEMAISA